MLILCSIFLIVFLIVFIFIIKMMKENSQKVILAIDDMLNAACDLIDDHDIANMRELRRFVRLHGAEYNLPSMKIINSVLRAHTGLIRLYFDAVYQERRYGRKDVDKETGEIRY